MRVLDLVRVAELGDGSLLSVRDEDRVVAEALAATRLLRDAPFEDARPAYLVAVRPERDDLRHVARAPVLDAFELAEQLRDRRPALGRVPRRVHTRTAAERVDLDAGVLRKHPHVRGRTRAPEVRLDARVAVVRVVRLGRIVLRVERVDRPAGEQPLELARLVGVARAE